MIHGIIFYRKIKSLRVKHHTQWMPMYGSVYVREGGWRSSATVCPTVVRPEADPALNWSAKTMTVRNDTKVNL